MTPRREIIAQAALMLLTGIAFAAMVLVAALSTTKAPPRCHTAAACPASV
jgi:hypothetical protein